MNKTLVVTAAILSLTMAATPGFSETKKGGQAGGKQTFEKLCASCHPNGGNIVNAGKPLGKKSLAAHGIKTEKDVVAKMRNPGPGMSKFDAKSLPDNEATALAGYILTTFK